VNPNIPDDRIKDRKQFVHWADELTDTEAIAAVKIISQIQVKYQYKTATKENLEALRDEALTRLSEINILAELDPAPILNGEPPTIEIKGKMAIDDIHQYGFDHEKKKWEIDKARERNEDYLGEKQELPSRKGGDKSKEK
jgi:hypothetical protein